MNLASCRNLNISTDSADEPKFKGNGFFKKAKGISGIYLPLIKTELEDVSF